MTAQKPLISALIMKQPHYLTVRERLAILSTGMPIYHAERGWKIQLNEKSGKLESDKISWVGSLPGFIFNNDIQFREVEL